MAAVAGDFRSDPWSRNSSLSRILRHAGSVEIWLDQDEDWRSPRIQRFIEVIGAQRKGVELDVVLPPEGCPSIVDHNMEESENHAALGFAR